MPQKDDQMASLARDHESTEHTMERHGANRILLTGATGFLGRAIAHAFASAGWDVVKTGFSRAGANSVVKLDLLDHNAVTAFIVNTRPDFIVHSAAEISPDVVATMPDHARAVNVDASAHLASVASLHSIPLLYISTEYVFPGLPGAAPYAESATPGPTNLYGQLKLEGEQVVLRNGGCFGAILRVPLLYGRVDPKVGNKESAVSILLDKVYESTRQRVIVDDWAQRYPANTDDIGKCIVEIGAKWLTALQTQTDSSFPTVLQFGATECFTKYEMCKIFAGILGLDISKMKGQKSDVGPVKRPYDTHMSAITLEQLLGGKLQTVDFRAWWKKELCG